MDIKSSDQDNSFETKENVPVLLWN